MEYQYPGMEWCPVDNAMMPPPFTTFTSPSHQNIPPPPQSRPPLPQYPHPLPASATQVLTQSIKPSLSATDQELLVEPIYDTPSDNGSGIVQGQQGITPLLSAIDQEPSLSDDAEVSTEAIAEDALHVGSDHVAMNTLDETKDDDNTTSGQQEEGKGEEPENEDKDDEEEDVKSGDVDSSIILQSPSQLQESTQNHHNVDTAEATTANSKSLTMKLLESGGDIRALLLSDQPLSSLRAQTADSGNEGGEPKNDSKDEDEVEVEEQRFVRPPRLRFALSDAAASDGFPSAIARSLRWHPDHMQDRPGDAANLSIRAAFDTKFDEYYVFRHWRPSQGR